MTKAQPQAPWQRGNPKPDAAHQALSPQAKAAARRRARKAGRPYPNLVDNMYEAQHTDGKPPAGRKAAAKKTAAKAPSAKKPAAKKATAATTAKATRKAAAKTADKPARKAAAAPAKKAATTTPAAKTTRDPQGGLTAAGRAEFARKDGAQLKPGVTKAIADMTPEEMRRKGSWAVRFYGRETLPPLQKANGEPTRFALSAHAWGEPVPKTEAQARKIAEKGERLLKRYEAAKAKKAKAQNKTPAATKAKR